MSDLPPVVVIVGPTAVGKTATSIALARRFDGEILSADSRQFYRGMEIGTAKATATERAAVPHHLLDLRDPGEPLTLAEFQQMAYERIAAIHAADRLPFLVGGTGLYVRAVVEGYGIPRVPPDPALRARLEAVAAEEGAAQLHRRLAAVDPAAADRIAPTNIRRVVRALEVYEKSGTPISVLQRRTPPPYRFLRIALTRPREVLYERVDRRIAQMLEMGLLDEVRALLAAGVPADGEAMSALGYRESVAFLRGEIEDEDALATEIGRSTRRFIRAQANWFRPSDSNLHWFDLESEPLTDIEALVADWLDRAPS